MLTAQEFWTPQGLLTASAGRWLIPPADPHQPLTSLTIDSRQIQPGQAFLAVPGERFDGHDFVLPALHAGASLAIVSRPPPGSNSLNEPRASASGAPGIAPGSTPGGAPGGAPGSNTLSLPEGEGRVRVQPSPFSGRSQIAASAPPTASPAILLVDDTVAALQRLARAWRKILAQSAVKVIAVTGSNGKTTTRHLIHALLSSQLRGSQSPKSFNNHLGVPLTLLAASATDNFLVAEVGSNHPGEIAFLADILQPDIAVLTHVGTAHIGQFGSQQAIALEKRSLYSTLQPQGLAVLPGNDSFLPILESAVPSHARRCRFGSSPSCQVRLLSPPRSDTQNQYFSASFTNFPAQPDQQHDFSLPLLGPHNIHNALAALAVARELGLSLPTLAAALAAVTPVAMRLQIERLSASHTVILNDAYNANPDSMRCAIDTLASYPLGPSGRRIAILGDMLELGTLGPDAHRQIGRCLADRSADIHLAAVIGKLSLFIAQELAKTWPPQRLFAWPQWDPTLPDQVARLFLPGDVILIKASRGLGLERLLPALRQRLEMSPSPSPTDPSQAR
ncbi:MAG: UDP-N-acetylmuramoyl-tripeptide--D-alanyl-D-alanine ligase [Phycisphaeraceae bacterium]|nr:UDP-N-acetylmuramoyl-tripeptide--D-alanyl-D-alanine ligase [Phycisphaeraceae bacterium]